MTLFLPHAVMLHAFGVESVCLGLERPILVNRAVGKPAVGRPAVGRPAVGSPTDIDVIANWRRFATRGTRKRSKDRRRSGRYAG